MMRTPEPEKWQEEKKKIFKKKVKIKKYTNATQEEQLIKIQQPIIQDKRWELRDKVDLRRTKVSP